MKVLFSFQAFNAVSYAWVCSVCKAVSYAWNVRLSKQYIMLWAVIKVGDCQEGILISGSSTEVH